MHHRGGSLARPDHIRPLRLGPLESLAQISRLPIICYPNAGLPDGMGGFVGPGRDGTAKITDLGLVDDPSGPSQAPGKGA
jgi:hypothetical protein